jgi:glucokinase
MSRSPVQRSRVGCSPIVARRMDIGNIAELNSFLVLDAIKSHGKVTRRQLSVELGLSDASVSRIVQRLLRAELIAEEPGDRAARGRTPTVLRFVGAAGSVIAIDLGGTRCHGALADLAGSTLTEDFRPTGEGSRAAKALLDCIAALRPSKGSRSWPVRAVVVGIPALIDPSTGLATAGPNVHWQDFDLLGILADEVDEPFEVDNDANLSALGQAWRGAGRGAHSFVTMSLGTGIGGGIVVDGHLLSGRHNAAGEVGYLPVGGGPGSPLTGFGFEEVASGPALRQQAEDLIARGEQTSLATGFTVADIFAAAADEDPVARRVVGDLVGHVAAAIVGMTALIDPERVILDGSIGRALERWLPELRAIVLDLVFGAPDIVISQLGPNAAVIGAVARALAMVAEQDAPLRLARRSLG